MTDTAETLLDRAPALVPILAERAPETEKLRRLPDETVADLKAAGYFPAGTNEPADGGALLSGAWNFVSGCDHADWFLMGSMIPDESGDRVPCVCLIPRSEVEIEDNWHVMGLCGTGSKNIVADGGFAPNHRIMPILAINGDWAARGKPNVPPLYRLPHMSTITFLFKATALGIAESMLYDFIEQTNSRSSFGNPVAEFATLQKHIAEAAAGIDCAGLLIKRDTFEAMEAMRAGEDLSLATRARNRHDQAYSSKLCRQAIDRLFGASGAHNIFSDNVSQRKFRDMRAASNHLAANWDVARTTFERVSFGLDPATRLI